MQSPNNPRGQRHDEETAACVIYARVSTVEQRMEGYSLPAQLAAAQEFATRCGLKIVKEFEESQSARTPGRPEFGKMLNYIAANPDVRTIVVHKLDRLARNYRDLADVEDLGIRIRCVSGDVPDGPAGTLFQDINMAFARNYSLNLSHEVSKGQAEKARQGGWLAMAPIGYLNDKATRTIYIDPVAGPLVSEAFQLYATGLFSLADLDDRMWEIGLRNRQGGRVHRATLHKALHNPLYCGKVTYKGEIYAGMHEPLVSLNLFERVQAVFKPNGTNNAEEKHQFVLRDFLRCGECGCKITAGTHKTKYAEYVYYRCTGGKGRGTCSQPGQYISEPVLMGRLVEILERIAIPDAIVRALVEEARIVDEKRGGRLNVEKEAVNRALGRCEQRLSALLDLRLDGDIDEESYDQKRHQLAEERTTLELRQRELAASHEDMFSQVERLARRGAGAAIDFQAGSDDLKREILSEVLCNLIVLDRNIASYQYKRPFDALEKDPEGAFCRAWSG